MTLPTPPQKKKTLKNKCFQISRCLAVFRDILGCHNGGREDQSPVGRGQECYRTLYCILKEVSSPNIKTAQVKNPHPNETLNKSRVHLSSQKILQIVAQNLGILWGKGSLMVCVSCDLYVKTLSWYQHVTEEMLIVVNIILDILG